MEKNKREQQYEKTLENIRTAVDELVNEVGFEQMRIRDICKRAGVSVGAFYHYFPSKNDLLMDRYVRLNAHIRTFAEKELKDLDPVDALCALMVDVISYLQTRFISVLVPFYKVLMTDYHLWQNIEYNEMEKLIDELVREGITRGTIESMYQPEEISRFLLSCFSGIVTRQCMTQGAFLEEDLNTRILLDWIQGLRG